MRGTLVLQERSDPPLTTGGEADAAAYDATATDPTSGRAYFSRRNRSV